MHLRKTIFHPTADPGLRRAWIPIHVRVRIAPGGPGLAGAGEMGLGAPRAVWVDFLSLALKLRRGYGAESPAWRSIFAAANRDIRAARQSWGVRRVCVGARAGKSSHRSQICAYIGRPPKGGHGVGARRRLAAEPLGYGVDALSIAQAVQDLLPLVVTGESGEDGLAASLLAAQLVDLGPEVVLGLAHGGFVYAFYVLLGFASSTWSLAVALEERGNKLAKVSRGVGVGVALEYGASCQSS